MLRFIEELVQRVGRVDGLVFFCCIFALGVLVGVWHIVRGAYGVFEDDFGSAWVLC